jgi:hypothetical protein
MTLSYPFILMMKMILMYQWNFKQNWIMKIHKVRHELQRLIQESIPEILWF